jgi:hypothetical protein
LAETDSTAVLDAPGNHPPGSQADPRYVVQLVITWPFRAGFLNKPSPTPFPSTKEDGLELIRQFAESWAEPFHSLANSICPSFQIKHLQLYDWLPPKEVHGTGNVALVGDAFHLMSMCKALIYLFGWKYPTDIQADRGEGANHATVDVLDLVEMVIPHLASDSASLQTAVKSYHNVVASRARPGVLASRQACMDAHDWSCIGKDSPLLSRRAMKLDFDDSAFD